MKLFLLIGIILLNTQLVNSQIKIDGRITDKKDKGIPGVSVTLKDTYDGATSDSTGYFSFLTTENGDHSLIITAVGYRPIEQ
ncbi:MAG: carboxypeptidase-like regulatory domain-containing protein, partial [Flavitalea sp.]